MQQVSATLQAAIDAHYSGGSYDLNECVEIYPRGYTPGASGFDPASAEKRFCAVEGLTIDGLAYSREYVDRGDIKRFFGSETNNVTLNFSNISRELATYLTENDVEGQWLVIRLYTNSSLTYADTLALFCGKLDKPGDIEDDACSLVAADRLGSQNLSLPPRNFGPNDPQGRTPDDPKFEGFRFLPVSSTLQYVTRERRTSGFGVLFGLSHDVTHSLQYSSHSNYEPENVVPDAFGRVQLPHIYIATIDIGGAINFLIAFCEGPIAEYESLRQTNPKFSQFNGGPPAKRYGYVGGEGPTGRVQRPVYVERPDLTGKIPGDGYYSRTAWVAGTVSGSTPDVDESEAPQFASVIKAKIVPVPNGSGVFDSEAWTHNPAYIARFLLSDPRYFNEGVDAIEDTVCWETGKLCEEPILDTSQGERAFVASPDATGNGNDFNLFRSTGIIDSRRLLMQAGNIAGDPFLQLADVEPFDPTDPPSIISPKSYLREKFTCNVTITQKVEATKFLFDVIAQTARLYFVRNSKGRIEIRSEQPADNTRLRTDTAYNDTTIKVLDADPWIASLSQRLVVGNTLTTSENRKVTAANYSADGDTITLAASATGGLTATSSGAHLSGGSPSTPSSGTVTIGGTPAAGDTVTITIGGITFAYTLDTYDTTASVAGMLANYINAIPALRQFVKASWSSGASVVTITAKYGVLTLDSPLLNAHAGTRANPTTSPGLTTGSGGSLEAGTVYVAYSYVNQLGESAVSPTASLTVTAGQQIVAGAIPLPAGIASINWYASKGNNSQELVFAGNTNGAAFTISALPDPTNSLPPDINTTGEESLRVALSLASNDQDPYDVWSPSTAFSLNTVIVPTVPNGHKYRVATAGTTGTAEPTWPASQGGTVLNGGVTFAEYGPTIIGQAGLAKANIHKGTFKTPLGAKQSSVNQAAGTYYDAKDDYAATPLIVNDFAHQARLGKTNKQDVDLSGFDNYNQSSRHLNFVLSKNREGDSFAEAATGANAILTEEGDLTAASSDNAGVVNYVTRAEEISIGKAPTFTTKITGRKYSTLMFSDQVRQHTIKLPTTLRHTAVLPTILELFDVPPFREEDATTPGFYAVVTTDPSQLGDWKGSYLYADYGAGYRKVSDVPLDVISAVGVQSGGTLPSPPSSFTAVDTVSRLRVVLTNDANLPDSITTAEMQADPHKNLCAWGGELIQYATKTLIDAATRTYELSNLMRGRFGTQGEATHSGGERFAVMGGAVFVAIDRSLIGQPFPYKAVTIRQDVSAATPITFTYYGAPTDPTGLAVQTASRAGVTLSWNANPESYVKGYTVERQDAAGGPWSVVASLVNATSFTDPSYPTTSGYLRYRLSAVSRGDRRSNGYATLDFTMAVFGTATAPVLSVASVGNGVLVLGVTPPTGMTDAGKKSVVLVGVSVDGHKSGGLFNLFFDGAFEGMPATINIPIPSSVFLAGWNLTAHVQYAFIGSDVPNSAAWTGTTTNYPISSSAEITPSDLALGTPGSGYVPAFNSSTGRLEYVPPSTVSGGADASSYKGNSAPTNTEFSYLSGVTSAIQTQLNTKATTAYVDSSVAALVNSAPTTLDTLKELADALGDDPNYAVTTATALGNRLRVDTAAQGLTATQQLNARTNIALNNVTNDAQTKAGIVPNTLPTAGQVLVGNAGGTAYAPQSVSGDGTLSTAGALTVSKTNGVAFAPSATVDTTNAANISTGILPNARLSAVPNSALANSTISGVSLGSNLASLSAGSGLTGSAYNGSAAQSWSVTNPVPANLTLTAPASAAVFTLAGGKTLAVNNTITLAAASDGFTGTIPATGTFALASGIAGGQTISGGTGAGDNLTLQSTSNAAKGKIFLGASSAYDGANIRLGVNTTSPSQALEVAGNVFVNSAVANLYLKDTSTGFQAASSGVVTPQSGNLFRNASFTSGLTGWAVNDAGSAEFADVIIRGAIRAAVLSYNAVLLTAGTSMVTKSAAKLTNNLTIPSAPTYGTTTVNVDVVDQDGVSHAASQLFGVGDVLKVQNRVLSGTSDLGVVGVTWLKVQSVSDQTSFWRYVCTVEAGSANVTYYKGTGVADFGTSGYGLITQTADQANAPYLQMATHAATFTSADSSGTLVVTPRLRLGNLNGSYGFNSNTYGFGAGTYGVANRSWITVEQAGGFRIGNNTSVLAQWDISGNILVGQTGVGQSNIYITSGAVDLRNNTTSRIHLASDGSGYVANNNFSWDTAGNVTIAGNATIAGLTVAATKLYLGTGTFNNSNTSFYVDTSNNFSLGNKLSFDGTTLTINGGGTFSGALSAATGTFAGSLSAATGTFAGSLSAATGTFAGSLSAATGTFAGSLSAATGTFAGSLSAATGSFSGSVTATSGAFTGTVQISSSTGALAVGSTPPTSATAGTGLWLDRTGLYSLMSGTQNYVLDAAGIRVIAAGTYSANKAFSAVDASGNTICMMGGYYDSATITGRVSTNYTDTGKHSVLALDSYALTASRNAYVNIEANSASYGGVTLNLTANSTGLYAYLTSAFVIGDTFPTAGYKLDVRGSGIFSGGITADTSTLYVDSTNHRVGVGTTAPGYLLEVSKAQNATTYIGVTNTDNTNTSSRAGFYFTGGTVTVQVQAIATSGGYLGTGSNHALYLYTNGFNRLIISPTGAMQFNAYGAGTLSTDSSGNVTTSSDEALKQKVGDFTLGMEVVREWQPISYRWKHEIAEGVDYVYHAYGARNVAAAGGGKGEVATGRNRDGSMTLSLHTVSAVHTNALKEHDARIAELEDQIKQARAQIDRIKGAHA